MGWKNGYGNTIEVRHGNETVTLYAHMNGFANGMSVGRKVKQGEVIGFVGKTGYATGPHLHYEFKVAGVHQDPLKVALPKAAPLPAAQKAQFDTVASAANSVLVVAQQARPANFE
jgi:murein DD-endopeptidase MepM/ murein hydrolase activator NlpD